MLLINQSDISARSVKNTRHASFTEPRQHPITIQFTNVGNVGYYMESETDCLSPQHVKARLQDIIEALKDNRDIDVPETEIRELQHFFNERSVVFLRAARHELRQRDAARRLQGLKRGIHYD